jgi:hypothetical protein
MDRPRLMSNFPMTALPIYVIEVDFDAFQNTWHVSAWSHDHSLVACLGHAVGNATEQTREDVIRKCVATSRRNRHEAHARYGRR